MADKKKFADDLTKLPSDQFDIVAQAVSQEHVRRLQGNKAFERKVARMGQGEFEQFKRDLGS